MKDKNLPNDYNSFSIEELTDEANKMIENLENQKDLEKSIEIGSAAAAIVVTKVGCAPAMPNLNEILEFMKYNKINEGE